MTKSDQKKQIMEEFDRKFVVKTGTKKISRVGYFTTPNSVIAVGHDPELIKDFFSQSLDSYGELVRQETIDQCLEAVGEDVSTYLNYRYEIKKGVDNEGEAVNRVKREIRQKLTALKSTPGLGGGVKK